MLDSHYVELQINPNASHPTPTHVPHMDDKKPTSRSFYILTGLGILFFLGWISVNAILQSKLTSAALVAQQLSVYMIMIQGGLFAGGTCLAWWIDVSPHWGSNMITCIYNLMCVMVYLGNVELRAGFHQAHQESFPECYTEAEDGGLICTSYKAALMLSVGIASIHVIWFIIYIPRTHQYRSTLRMIMKQPFQALSFFIAIIHLLLFFVLMVLTIHHQLPRATSGDSDWVFAGYGDWLLAFLYFIISILCLLYKSYHPTLYSIFISWCWCFMFMCYMWSFSIMYLKQWKSFNDVGITLNFTYSGSYIIQILLCILHSISILLFSCEFIMKWKQSTPYADMY